MKIIHDHLWGDIEVSDLAIQWIDTPAFQRLHYIKQTGFSYKVFPSATTTRFQHSLGVYHVIKIVLRALCEHQPELVLSSSVSTPFFDERKRELLCIAGLLHDIGHGPYSHWFDSFLSERFPSLTIPWTCHEERSADVIRYIHKEHLIEMTDDEIQFVIDRILGVKCEQWYDRLVHNQETGIDCDKIDYVLRDSLNFGLSMKFDPHRIFQNTRVISNELSYCDRIQDEIMTLFLIRNKLHHHIYRHRKIVEFENQFSNGIRTNAKFCHLLETIAKNQDMELFLSLHDYSLLTFVSNWSMIECRQKDNSTEPIRAHQPSSYKDTEWFKITRLKFYHKKNSFVHFPLMDWNISSCFSATTTILSSDNESSLASNRS